MVRRRGRELKGEKGRGAQRKTDERDEQKGSHLGNHLGTWELLPAGKRCQAWKEGAGDKSSGMCLWTNLPFRQSVALTAC